MRQLKPCGTEAAYRRHARHGENACAECLAAHRVYHRIYQRTVRAGRPVRQLKPCGTRAAYDRHLRRGERACFPCRLANSRRDTRRKTAA